MNLFFTIFWQSLQLGLTSFGGPSAHLGYFHQHYVKKLKWLSEKQYADLVALSQFLPGPASSQVGFGIGVYRGGLIGGIASFIGFTLPSVLILMLIAIFAQFSTEGLSWLHGLQLVAVVIVLQALIQMRKQWITSSIPFVIASFSLVVSLFTTTFFAQMMIILMGLLLGLLLSPPNENKEQSFENKQVIHHRTALLSLLLWGILFILPYLSSHSSMQLFRLFYQAGAFVFGGGHVVLPFLEQSFVTTAIIPQDIFYSGYSAAQAVPGPLFTFASFLGYYLNGVTGLLVATLAIFLPGFLLLIGIFPYWEKMRAHQSLQGPLKGVSAAVVGMLAATFIRSLLFPLFEQPLDFLVVFFLGFILFILKRSPLFIVSLGIILGLIFYS